MGRSRQTPLSTPSASELEANKPASPLGMYTGVTTDGDNNTPYLYVSAGAHYYVNEYVDAYWNDRIYHMIVSKVDGIKVTVRSLNTGKEYTFIAYEVH